MYNSSAKTLALYVNGVLQQSVACPTVWQCTGNTLIGRTKWGGTALSFCQGSLDDLRFYTSALTAAQITTLYNMGGTPPPTYTLTISTSGNGTTTPAAGTYTYNSNTVVSVTANPGSGATFSGWSGAATGTANPVSITMNANKSLTATFTGGGGSYYSWPSYSPDPSYDYVNEFGTINPPTSVLNDCANVSGTVHTTWWCFRYGPSKNSLVTANAWNPMLAQYEADFSYITDTMRWPRDSRARAHYYSAVYLYGSGLCTDTAANTALGGWQSPSRLPDGPAVLLPRVFLRPRLRLQRQAQPAGRLHS